MSGFRKNIREIALFLTCMVVVLAYADVKLRIYLQDGSLQAGNLVSETKEAFVVLTKEGRVEVAKNRIMFVNGKTLKQWEERPDRLFQTEIIPSDIPNPSYVNDRAKLPVVEPVAAPIEKKSVISPVQKEEAPAAKKPLVEPVAPLLKKDEPVVSPQAVAAAPLNPPQSKAEKTVEKPAQEPITAAAVAQIEPEKPRRRQRLKKKIVEPTKETAPVIHSDPVAPAPTFLVEEMASLSAKPARFSRSDYAHYHYQRAIEYLGHGWKGQAIQELHIAALLNRRDEKTAFELARLYKEEGQYDRAEKFLIHPVLKKNSEAKKMLQDIQATKIENDKSKKILFGITGAGLFSTLPLLFLARRFGRRSKKVRVITAENAEELLTPSDEQDLGLIQKQPAVQSLDQMISDVLVSRPTLPINKVPPVIETPKKGPEIKPAAEVPLTSPPKVEKPAVPSSPAELPPVFSIPIPEPMANKEPVPEPMIIEESVLPPLPPALPVLPPVLASQPGHSVSSPLPTVDEVLATASQVDEALERGNALAMEGHYDRARREYRTALALNPSRLEPYLGMGYLCFLQQQWDLAFEHYVKALQINPNSPDAHYGIGRIMLETERVDEAVPRFQMTLKLDPTYDDARDCLTLLGKPV